MKTTKHLKFADKSINIEKVESNVEPGKKAYCTDNKTFNFQGTYLHANGPQTVIFTGTGFLRLVQSEHVLIEVECNETNKIEYKKSA